MRRFIKMIFVTFWEIIWGFIMMVITFIVAGISAVVFGTVAYLVTAQLGGHEVGILFASLIGFVGLMSGGCAMASLDTHPIPDRGAGWDKEIKKWD